MSMNCDINMLYGAYLFAFLLKRTEIDRRRDLVSAYRGKETYIDFAAF